MSDQTLFPEHREELEKGSGISSEVIEGRGYRTIETKATLKRYGYSPSQGGEGPWLWIPLFSPDSDGSPTGYQIKPTGPRVDPTGRVMKYEFPKGSVSTMDVHPSNLGRIADVQVPLYITEGTKKADAAASHGLLALSIAGVWGWKAGQLPHESWNVIPLQDREVFLAFDSDAVTKPGVHDALSALVTFLTKRGAKVKTIIFPVLAEGSKTGLDDFLLEYPAKTLEAYVVDELPPRPPDEVGKGLVYQTEDGEHIHLANFDARIVADIVKDNGMEQSREIELEATLGSYSTRFVLSVDDFEKMDWNIDHLGSDSILFAGRDIPQKAREVIQAKSIGKEERHVYTHTGWRKIRVHSEKDKEWVYLGPMGAISASGLVDHVAVELGELITGIDIPDPPSGDALTQAVRDSLLLTDPEVGVMPLDMYFTIWRSVFGKVPFGYWIHGSTGVGKSELAALAQQHWGSDLVPSRFLANWMSTENYINEVAFRLKDMLLVVDDYKPSGSRHVQLRLNQMAERLYRSQGNQAGRGRMNRDLTLQQGHPVRSLLLTTAEDIPEGESLLARMIVKELPRDDERFDRLDLHQANAAEGQYAKTMGGFLRWVAPRYEQLQEFIETKVKEYRKQFLGRHRRTREAGANLMVTATVFLQFAEDIEAVTPLEKSRILDRLAAEIRESGDEQAVAQMGSQPIRVARELLLAGMTQGKLHIEGYPKSNVMGEMVGWVMKDHKPQDGEVGDYLFLMTVAFRGALNRMAEEKGMDFPWTSYRFGKALAEDGWFVGQDSQSGTNSAVARYDGHTHRVWRVPLRFLTEVEETDEDSIDIPEIEEAF